ncbi:MAG TPA: hypothetical protein VMS02_07930 [Solirubrobacteraceae bacterium]|nr:hypothetical protein [Solirubrobacteraceae bacterium]
MGAQPATAASPTRPERPPLPRRGSQDRIRRRPGAPPWGLTAAAVGVAVWLLVDPRTPDLAAQVYRANLFRAVGWTVWDGRWYGGHTIPGYSLVFPPLAAWLGVRAVGALAVLASAAVFERLARGVFGAGAARWGAVWFALAALGDVWSGRVTFALGVSFAMFAVAACVRARTCMRARPRTAVAAGAWTAAAVALAAVCAACSPVAGVLLGLAGVTYALVERSPRSVLVLGLAPALVVGALAGLFSEGGWEPYPLLSFLATAAVMIGFLAALPPGRTLLRVGGALYLLACVACVAVHTPMGANVERYGVLLAGPLLLCALLAPGAARPRLGRVVGVAALLGIAVWTVWGPVRETLAVAGNASSSAGYYEPVERFVAAHGGDLVRIEVPFTRGHWEAAWLAAKVSLARGWEKQLDERYNGVLLHPGLTAVAYRHWLDEQAVSYVALPDAPLDPSSAGEGALIRSGLPYLHLVQRTRHWRIYRVLGAMPLASGPGALTALGHDWFALRARAAGRFVVRVHYTRYWAVTRGAACVSPTPAGWTEVRVARAGAVRVATSFSLGRALGLGGGCRLGASG